MAAALPALPLAAAGGGPVGLLVLLVSLLVGTFVVASKRQRSSGLSAISGPPQHALLGNFFDLATPRSHQVVEGWGERFGALARFKLLHDSILITDPVIVEDVLGRRGADELPKPPLIYSPLDPIYSPKSIPSFFTTRDADMWAAVRKGCAPAFSSDNMRKAFPVVRDAVQQVGDSLEAQAALPAGKQGVDMQDAALRVALDSFALPALQHDFGARRCGECEVLQVLPNLLAEFSRRALNPLRAVLHALAPWGREAAAFSSNLRKAHALWAQLAAEVRATDLAAADAAGDTSLRACLARLRDPATGQLLSEEQLAPQVAAFLVAGFETTAHSVSWALVGGRLAIYMYEVARNQEVQARLVAELAEAGLVAAPGRPARQLEQADLSSLPYLDQVWREALRLHPVASIGPIRQADRDVTLKNGLHVPQGTMLWTSACAIHTSDHNFVDAKRFWPERWAQPGAATAAEEAQGAAPAAAAAGEGAAAAGGGRCPFGFSGHPTPAGNSADPRRSFVAFSYGPRDCMGQALATMVGKAMIASLVSHFALRVAPRMGSYEQVRAAEVNRLTMQSGAGVWLLLEPRGA